MQPPKFRTEIFGNRPTTTSVEHENIFNIGPWPVKRSRSEGEVINHVNVLKDPSLSFSDTMTQIDEVYALTKEIEGSERSRMHGLHYKKRVCDFLLAFLMGLAAIIAAAPPLVAYIFISHQRDGILLSMTDMIDAQWSGLCLTLFYVAATVVGTVLWMTLVLIRHIRNPFAVPLSIRTLGFSIWAGNLLAIWTLLWLLLAQEVAFIEKKGLAN